MKTLVPCLLLALCAFATPASAQTRRALVVGIDRYAPVPASGESDGAGVKPFADLSGAVNDARAMRAVLQARYGFAAEDIVSLTDEGATRAAILSALREHLIERSEPGDIALLFYAGHGSLIRDSRNAATENPYDQTLVPHDFNTGALPILDKELRALLGDLLDTGAHVSAFFDSCHSGSITRGLPEGGSFRWVPPDPRDAAELYERVVDERPSPESRGAIVMSAAQDDQRAKETVDESGTHHGLFSSALLRVLRTEPVDQTALNVYQRVRALVQTETSRQVPQLGGLGAGSRDDSRYASTRLIGPTPEGASGGLAVAVRAIEDGRVRLPGGHALGLAAGTELTAVSASVEPEERAGAEREPVRLRVSEVLDLDSSLAEVVEGKLDNVKVGDLFEVSSFVTEAASPLKIWIGASRLDEGAIDGARALLAELARAEGLEWAEDPTALEDSAQVNHLRLTDSGWELRSPGVSARSFGPAPLVSELLAILEAHSAYPLLVELPPTAALASALIRAAVRGGSVRVASSLDEAHYALFGSLANGALAYRWVRPGAFGGDDVSALGMPMSTDWVALAGASVEEAHERLGTQARRIARARDWLRLESPPEKHPFPYRLQLRDVESKAVIEGRDLIEGEAVEIALHADELPRRQRQRYVYLMALDSGGGSQLLFGRSVDDNAFPRVGQEQQRTFTLVSPVHIRKPFGVDTLILLTTSEKIGNTQALAWEGVRSEARLPGPTRGAAARNPLERLLNQIGGATRGESITTPADWSIERLRFVTRAAD